METEDPRAALGAKDLPTQAAAARDLSQMGTWEDLDPLLELATGHKRTGMRLIAAAAAADILHRHRTGALEPLDKEQQRQIVEWVKRTDPGLSPSALMMLSAFPERDVVSRLGRLLRDPRNDVRTGAAVAIRRMAVSDTMVEPERSAVVRQAIPSWLGDRRTPPDAVVALVNLIGNLGWEELREVIFGLQSTSQVVMDAIALAQQRLDARKELDGWSGLYVSDGRDALELTLEERDEGLLLVGGGTVSVDGGEPVEARIEDGRLHADALPGPARLAWVPRIGEHEMHQAIQVQGRTWYRIEGKDAVDWLDTEGHRLGPDQRPATRFFEAEFEELEGATGKRARAVAAWLAGDMEAADEQLTALTGTKKPRADLYFWLGELRREQGRGDEARTAWQTFLERAPKRAPLRPIAEARLEELS